MKNFNKKPELVFKENGDVFLHLFSSKYLNRYRGKIFVGHVFADKKVFVTAKKDDKHIYRLHNSISLPRDLFLRPARFLYICCPFNNTNIWTSIRAIKKYGITLFNEIYGFERQVTLALNKWHRTKKEARLERIKIKKGEIK